MLGSLLLAGLVWGAGNTTPLLPVALPMSTVRVAAAVRPAPKVMQVSLADAAAGQEAAFVTLINAERAERGLSTLTLDPMLTETARAHSEEMCSADYFDHHSPTPGIGSPMDRYLSASRLLGLPQPEYLLVGENIYYCSVCNDIYNVDYAHRALMASPGHRANILEPRFAKIGVGVYRNSKGEFWVTEMFSRDRNP